MRTLLVRLSISHLLVALGSLALLLWLSPQLFLHYYLVAEQQRLSVAVRGLAATAERLAQSPGRENDLALLVRTSGIMLGGEVALIGGDGDRVLLASHGSPATAGWALAAWETYRQTGRPPSMPLGQATTITLVAPTGRATPLASALVVRHRAPELQTLLRAHRLMTAASAAIALALALILSLVVSRAVASPLVAMSRAAQHLAAGDFSVTVPERGPAEVTSLAASLNRMASALAATFAALEGERQRLADVLATMGEGVIGLDGAGRITIANRAASELLGQNLPPGSDLTGAIPAEQVAQAMAALAAGSPLSFAFSRGDRYLSCSLTPAAGGGAVLVMADVTATRQLDNMRREFVAAVSHELRAPLTSIRGFLGAILDGTAREPEELDHCIRVADQEAARMARLVEELLELSRLQAGVMEFEFAPTDVGDVARGVANAFAPRLAQTGLRLDLDVEEGLPLVEADGDRLAQVFTNLLDNALRYSPAGGAVTIHVRPVTPAELTELRFGETPVCELCLLGSVRDQGPGIAETDLGRIWERFHKSDRARTRTDPGAGLGLAIVREIIRAHGGDVFARNHPAGGAEVGFWLPFARSSAAAERPEGRRNQS